MPSTAQGAMAGMRAGAQLLSSLIAGPVDSGLLWQVRDQYFTRQWERHSPEAQRGLALLRESAVAREDLERLGADFHRLFGEDGCGIVARESAYRPGVTAEQLAALYDHAGIDVPADLPADHLAAELQFVARLPESARTTLADFTHEHLRMWAPECFGEISLRAGSLFYQGVGALGMDYIESLPVR
ncbi:MAG: TorD/DmsD family molecular chaperone [Actinomycetota bacterium]